MRPLSNRWENGPWLENGALVLQENGVIMERLKGAITGSLMLRNCRLGNFARVWVQHGNQHDEESIFFRVARHHRRRHHHRRRRRHHPITEHSARNADSLTIKSTLWDWSKVG